MRSLRKSGVTALTAGIALAIGAVPVAFVAPAIVASGETTTVTPAGAPAGQVVLSTTSDKGIIEYEGLRQEFTGGQQCEVTTTGDDLLRISGSIGGEQAGVAGFRDGNIGVFESTDSGPDNASQCSRVDSGSFTTAESLTIELDQAGPYSDAPFADRLLVGSATVDAKVANTRSGEITISFLDANGDQIEDAGVPVTVPAPWSNQKSGSDIDVPELVLEDGFSGIRLTAADGAFTVQGATFDLVSQADATFCSDDNQTNPAGTNSIQELNTTVEYLGNAVSEQSCFSVQLTPGYEEVRFIYPLGTAPADAQFLYEIDWAIPGTGTPEVTLPQPQIAFDPAEENFNNLPFCPDALYGVNEAGERTGPEVTAEYFPTFNDPNSELFVDFEPSIEAKQYACVDTRVAPGVSSDSIEIADTVFVIGDAKMRL